MSKLADYNKFDNLDINSDSDNDDDASRSSSLPPNQELSVDAVFDSAKVRMDKMKGGRGAGTEGRWSESMSAYRRDDNVPTLPVLVPPTQNLFNSGQSVKALRTYKKFLMELVVDDPPNSSTTPKTPKLPSTNVKWKVRLDEGRLERSDSKSNAPPTRLTNKLPLIAPRPLLTPLLAAAPSPSLLPPSISRAASLFIR